MKISQYLQRIHPGNRRFLRGCTITQTNSFVMNVAVCWNKAYEEPWILMTTHANLSHVGAKSYSAIVLLDRHYSKDIIRTVIQEVTEKLKHSNY